MAFAGNARLAVIVVGVIVLAADECSVHIVVRARIDRRAIRIIASMRLMQAAPK
jgi:hypothetical protein